LLGLRRDRLAVVVNEHVACAPVDLDALDVVEVSQDECGGVHALDRLFGQIGSAEPNALDFT
jgi:hypothetical protein